MTRFGIAFRLAFFILSAVAITLALILAYNYKVSRDLILKNVESSAESLAEATVYKLETVLYSVQKVSENVALSLDELSLTKDEVQSLGERVLENNNEIFGTTIAFEPYEQDAQKLYFAARHQRTAEGFSHQMLGGESYRYFYMDWYQLPKELDAAVWIEPYHFKGPGNKLMATCSVPFYRTFHSDKEFTGVVSVDLSLDWLEKSLESVAIMESGFAFLVSRRGTFITHKDKSLVLNETIFSVAEAKGDLSMREIGRKMVQGESGLTEMYCYTLEKDCYLYFEPLASSGWSLGILIPKDELFNDVAKLTRDIVLIGIAGFLILFLVIWQISKNIIRPLRSLTSAADVIAGGELDAEIPVTRRKDEVGMLSHSFTHMQSSLKEYIANLTETTTAKERIESELRIARDIQLSIVPKIFPPFPERSEFDIYATMVPAREVGGDLFDFFFVDDRTFCFLIGDVSDKGVPAALFMAVTKTLIKVVAENEKDPGAIMGKVNKDLSENNESCMFVTLFIGMLDVVNGEVRYACAGHDPPLLLRKGERPTPIPVRHELIAGIEAGMEYTTDRVTLQPGDSLYMYTDGVTEAMDEHNEMFTEDRLVDSLAWADLTSARTIVETVKESVDMHTGGAAQSDDITTLALRFNGSGE